MCAKTLENRPHSLESIESVETHQRLDRPDKIGETVTIASHCCYWPFRAFKARALGSSPSRLTRSAVEWLKALAVEHSEDPIVKV